MENPKSRCDFTITHKNIFQICSNYSLCCCIQLECLYILFETQIYVPYIDSCVHEIISLIFVFLGVDRCNFMKSVSTGSLVWFIDIESVLFVMSMNCHISHHWEPFDMHKACAILSKMLIYYMYDDFEIWYITWMNSTLIIF